MRLVFKNSQPLRRERYFEETEKREYTEEELRKIIETTKNRRKRLDVYTNYALSPELIKIAIERGDRGENCLWTLYREQILTPELIKLAIKKGEDLNAVYAFQELDPESIKLAIEKGVYLGFLYYAQELTTPELIKLAIEKGEYLDILFEKQDLFGDLYLIKEGLIASKDDEDALEALYKYQISKLSKEKREEIEEFAIKKGIDARKA